MSGSRRTPLDAPRITQLLTRLGVLATRRGIELRLTVVGGAAMALGFGTRRSTHDIDVVRVQPSQALLHELAVEIALEEGLGEQWISGDASRFAKTVSEGPVLMEAAGIRVHAVSDVQMLAMKLDAMRDDVDREDAIIIAARLGFDQNSTELSVAPYLEPARYKRACFELDDIWLEVEHARR